MRALGLNAYSAGAIRIVRRDVARLELDTSHFRGKRIWSDAQLRRAVINAQSEKQTRKDSTDGLPRPMGQRDAHEADTLGESRN